MATALANLRPASLASSQTLTTTSSTSSPDSTTLNAATLQRLLSRLDQTLFPAPTSPSQLSHLRRSAYERNRVAANLDHARSLLLTLERQIAGGIRAQTDRQRRQAELQKQREWIKRLAARLREMGDEEALGAGGDENETLGVEDGEYEEGEDLLGRYCKPAASTSTTPDAAAATTPAPASSSTQQPESTLRARRLQASDNRTSASSSAREQLFSGRQTTSSEATDIARTETLMSSHRIEQESLTDNLLQLARALKESSQTFGAALESEKEVLKRAEGGLDKNAQGMEAAERRMGMLRKMSEGQGWWGRLKLYGFIAALWLGCFLLVFVGPKLRF